jgi:hypothetical protein
MNALPRLQVFQHQPEFERREFSESHGNDKDIDS